MVGADIVDAGRDTPAFVDLIGRARIDENLAADRGIGIVIPVQIEERIIGI